jgi:hypothetical protein
MVNNPFVVDMRDNDTKESKRMIELRDPPSGYDSVQGMTCGTVCYMKYSNANLDTYPMYLVYFS